MKHKEIGPFIFGINGKRKAVVPLFSIRFLSWNWVDLEFTVIYIEILWAYFGMFLEFGSFR